MRRLTRWLRRCFPMPMPAMRYQPRHLALVAAEPEHRTEPIALLETPVHTPDGHPLGSIRVYAPEAERLPPPDRHLALVPGDPDDAIFDAELSWHSAWKAHERGDDDGQAGAIQKWLDAGWLADPWWLRRAVA